LVSCVTFFALSVVNGDTHTSRQSGGRQASASQLESLSAAAAADATAAITVTVSFHGSHTHYTDSGILCKK